MLSWEDFEGIEIKEGSSKLDILSLVCRIAHEKQLPSPPSINKSSLGTDFNGIPLRSSRKGRESLAVNSSCEKSAMKEISASQNKACLVQFGRKGNERKQSKSKPNRKRDSQSVDKGDEKVPRPKKQMKNIYMQDQPDPDLPEEFKNRIREMNGTELLFVAHKRLTPTDVDVHQDRCLLPFLKIKNTQFLTDEEKKDLEIYYEKERRYNAIKARLIQPVMLTETEIHIKRWRMAKKSGKINYSYLLQGSWRKVSKDNKLCVNDRIGLWSFRVGEHQLCFALVVLEKAIPTQGNSGGSSSTLSETIEAGTMDSVDSA